MDRDIMLSRLEAGYSPIDVAIEKWRDIVADPRMERGGFILDESNCALCHVTKMECHLCPIVKSDGVSCTDDNKGSQYDKSHNKRNPQIMLDELLRVKAWILDEACKDGKKGVKRLSGVKFKLERDEDSRLTIEMKFGTPNSDGIEFDNMIESLVDGDVLYLVSEDMIKKETKLIK